MAIAIGQAAPDFSLFDSEKNKVTLSEMKGKNVVLLFFPLAFTGVCTKELCSVRDNIATYNDTNAQVLGISVDSPFTLANFKEENNFQFPLLSDFNKEVSTAFGAIYEQFVFNLKGVSKRAAFVLDENQKVIYAEVLESAGDLPDFTAIDAIVK